VGHKGGTHRCASQPISAPPGTAFSASAGPSPLAAIQQPRSPHSEGSPRIGSPKRPARWRAGRHLPDNPRRSPSAAAPARALDVVDRMNRLERTLRRKAGPPALRPCTARLARHRGRTPGEALAHSATNRAACPSRCPAGSSRPTSSADSARAQVIVTTSLAFGSWPRAAAQDPTCRHRVPALSLPDRTGRDDLRHDRAHLRILGDPCRNADAWTGSPAVLPAGR
jgi:hypothetical protein